MSDFRSVRIFGRIIKSLFVLLIVAVNAILLWRVFFSTAIPESIKTLSVSQATQEAYRAHGEELVLQYQEQSTITRGDKNAGYFAVPSYVFIPEANQVQVVLRYNNSTLEHLYEDYELDAIPDKAGDWFDVTLVATRDLTPGDRSDNERGENLAKERFTHSEVTRDTTLLYTYYRYVFDGISVDADTVGVFVDVYYNQSIHYELEAYGRLCIYSDDEDWLPYRLTKKDREALEAAVAD